MNFSDILQLTYRPVGVIQAKVDEKPKLLVPILLFFVVLALDFANNWMIAGKFLDVFPLVTGEIKGKMQLYLMQQVANQEIQLTILLFIGTGILMCLAVLLDGVGDYRKLLELIASCHIVIFLFEVFFLAFVLWYSPQNLFEPLKGVTPEMYEKWSEKKQQHFGDQAKAAVKEERARFAFKLQRTLKHLAYLWLAILCVLVMVNVGKLTKPKAIGAVGGLSLFYILLQYLPSYLMKE